MSNLSEDPGHGSSPAAWIAVTVMLLGVAIGTLFLFLNVLPLVLVGAALLPIGLILGAVLARAGLGVAARQSHGAH